LFGSLGGVGASTLGGECSPNCVVVHHTAAACMRAAVQALPMGPYWPHPNGEIYPLAQWGALGQLWMMGAPLPPTPSRK